MDSKKIIGFALGPIASAAFGLLTVPMIAWIFSAEDIGRMNMLQTTISACMLVFTLGLDQAYVREFHDSKNRARLLKACFIPGFLLLTGTGLVTLGFSSRLSHWLFGSTDPVFYWLTLMCVIATFVLGFLSLILRMHEHGLMYSISQVISRALLLAIIGSIAVFNFTGSFLQLQFSFLASTVIAMLAYLWITRKLWQPAISMTLDRNELSTILKFGAPLIVSGFIYWGLIATSSIALRSLSSFSELGIYSITLSFAGVAVVLQSIFTVIWAPVIYRWVAEEADLTQIDSIAQQLLAVLCGIVILCGIFSWLIDYILPAQYSQVKYLILCGMIQPLLYTLSEVTCAGINIMRRTMFAVWIALLAFAVNVTLSLWLVPLLGAAGAVIANSVAFVVFFVARSEASAYVWRRIPRARIYTFVCLAVSLSVMTAVLGPHSHFNFTFAWLFLLPFYVFLFRNELKLILKFLLLIVGNRGDAVSA